MFNTFVAIIDVLVVVVPSLLSVAFVTVAERKTMASMQRRLGPNMVGHYGLLQAFADALKLLLKEYVGPTQSNFILFVLGPFITLNFSLLGYGVVAYGAGMAISDLNLGILYMLAVSSLSTYGILLAGWSANSKYAFLGSLRSTAQLISYELILSSVILLIVLLSGTLNITLNVETQKMVYFLFPLFPLFIIFFIGCIAETNRAPFDLAEAESELVSGFMTEHSAVIFVFFFLAEYASIILICIFSSILFIGGYLVYYTFDELIYIFSFISTEIIIFVLDSPVTLFSILYQGISSSLTLGFKTCILIFIFILARASFPRVRYDQLMSYCWTILLPIIIGFIVFIPCLVFSLLLIPVNTSLDGSSIILLTISSIDNVSCSIPDVLIKEISGVLKNLIQCLIMIEISHICSDFLQYQPDLDNNNIMPESNFSYDNKSMLSEEDVPNLLKDHSGIRLPITKEKDLDYIKFLDIAAVATMDGAFTVFMADNVTNEDSSPSENFEPFTSGEFNNLLNDIVRINRLINPQLRTTLHLLANQLREPPGPIGDPAWSVLDIVNSSLNLIFERDTVIDADHFNSAGMRYPVAQITWSDWFIIQERTNIFDEFRVEFEGMFETIDDNDIPEDYFICPEDSLLDTDLDIGFTDFATLFSNGISESELLTLLHLPAGTNLNGFVGISFEDLVSIYTNIKND